MNELKKELSKLSGVDMFNPKYRDVFKKYFPNDKDVEEEKLEEMGVEEPKMEDKKEEILENKKEEIQEDVDKAEDEREIDKIEEMKSENTEKKDDKKEEVQEESEEISKKVDEENSVNEELLNTKIELELVRANIRPEKIKSAMVLAKQEIKSLEDLDKIKDIIKEIPEWTKQREQSKSFGMDIDESGDGLTEEEKRLKQMGIDPRN